MRARILIIAAAALLLFPGARALGASRIGLGVMAGEPTGLSLKAWGDSHHALDAAAGWAFGHGGWVYLHGDFLWHRYEFDVEGVDASVPYYFGIGCRVLLRDERDSRLGVRLPLGLDYLFEDGRLDAFIEVAPVLDLIPETELRLTGGAGIRFYF